MHWHGGGNVHQAVGAIADHLLIGSHAKTEVNAILGVAGNNEQLTLEKVSVWSDCVRSINPDKDFAYDPGQYRGGACAIFEDDVGINEMASYARRNNSNCEYSGKRRTCHKAFHFTDIDIGHDHYSGQHVGANDHDIVHAINAAIAVLKGNPSPYPFNLNKKDALMLLAHMMGDLHQPCMLLLSTWTPKEMQ